MCNIASSDILLLDITDHPEEEFDPLRTQFSKENPENIQLPESSTNSTETTEDDLQNLVVPSYIPPPPPPSPPRICKVCKDKCFWLILIGLIISSAVLITGAPLGFLYTKRKISSQTQSFNTIFNTQPGTELLYAVYIGNIKGYEHSKVTVTTNYDFVNDNVTVVLSKELKKKSSPQITINQTLRETLRTRYVAGGFNYTVNITGPMESLINISVSIVNDHTICSSGFKVIGNSSIPFNCTSDEMGYYGFYSSGDGKQEGVLTYEILDVGYYNNNTTSLECVLNETKRSCSIELGSFDFGTYYIIAMLPPNHIEIHVAIDGRIAMFGFPAGFIILLLLFTIPLLIVLSIRICKVY